ncbi:MAG: Na+/H+ antiporter NhaC family protein [Verrucomicrobiota bacterium]
MNEVGSHLWKAPQRWLICFLALSTICLFLWALPTGPVSVDAAEAGKGHWSSLLPPLVAVVVAISFRSLVAALTSAFFTGAVLYYGLNPLVFIPQSLNNFLFANIFGQFSLYIFGFLFALVGMIHVLYKSGGIQGLVEVFSKIAKGARSAQAATISAGFMIFFDDYSNTIVVGQTMRSLTDRWKISREKLAYLVDSTTAPIAGLAVVSTWIAYEIWLLGSTARSLGMESGGYAIFLEMLPMRFYCWGTLMFLVCNVLQQRDFGPMLKAEKRARELGQLQAPDARPLLHENPHHLEPPAGIPHRWYNAAIPLFVVFLCVIGGILYVGSKRLIRDGETPKIASLTGLQDIFGIVVYDPSLPEGGPGVPMVLFWAAVAGGIVAILMPVVQKLLTTVEAARSYSGSLPTLGVTLFIVPMAWAMKTICESLGTSYYLLSLVGDSLPVATVPLLTFVLAAGMAFAMGTSWGTMGVMIPIMLPFVWQLGADDPMQMTLFILTSAAVLDGAIFGDHCSPISDTTVLSSIATGCDHLHHVATQLPYALTTMLLASVLGYTLIAFTGIGAWLYFILFPISALSIIRTFGRKVA